MSSPEGDIPRGEIAMSKHILIVMLLLIASCATTGNTVQEADETTETASVMLWCVAFGILGIECDE